MKIKFLKEYNEAKVGDIAEIEDVVQAKGLIASGYAEEYKEAPQHVVADVDTKSIADAISESLKAVIGTTKTETVEEKPYQFKNLGEFAQAIHNKTVNITTTTQGNYATTDYVDPAIQPDVLTSSAVASKVRVLELTDTNNNYKFNVIDSIGTAPAVVSESGTVATSQPTIAQVSIDLAKIGYMYYATMEALQDTGALVGEINSFIPEIFGSVLEKAILVNGTLSSFAGIISHAETATVAKVSGQSPNTIVAANIDAMYSAAKKPEQSVWIMSRSAYSAIQGLESTLGERLFVGPNGLAPSPFGTLKGLPILVSDHCKAVGTVGDILLANLNAYRMVRKAGLEVAESEHVAFADCETAFRFILRAGGAPVGQKLTADDSSEIADFVELATRS
jgi:HK97 family phage major capsid protein